MRKRTEKDGPCEHRWRVVGIEDLLLAGLSVCTRCGFVQVPDTEGESDAE